MGLTGVSSPGMRKRSQAAGNVSQAATDAAEQKSRIITISSSAGCPGERPSFYQRATGGSDPGGLTVHSSEDGVGGTIGPRVWDAIKRELYGGGSDFGDGLSSQSTNYTMTSRQPSGDTP